MTDSDFTGGVASVDGARPEPGPGRRHGGHDGEGLRQPQPPGDDAHVPSAEAAARVHQRLRLRVSDARGAHPATHGPSLQVLSVPFAFSKHV